MVYAFCRVCHRPLTDPESVKLGIGPICLSRIGGDRQTTDIVDLPWDEQARDIIFQRLFLLGQETLHFNIPQVHRHHSPSGYEWGSESTLVDFDVTVGAQQREPFRVSANLRNLRAATLHSLDATVRVVEVEGGWTSFIAAARTRSPELFDEGRALSPFLVAPSLLIAGGAPLVVTLETVVSEQSAALVAKSISTQVNAGTDVLFFRTDDLPAHWATIPPRAVETVRGLAVFAVGDEVVAASALDAWMSHSNPPDGLYAKTEDNVRREHSTPSGSGPADFALNILAVFTDELPERPLPEWELLGDKSRCHPLVYQWHQDFKRDFISIAPGPGCTIRGDEIRAWIDNRLYTEEA